jgi:hypothetical protein
MESLAAAVLYSRNFKILPKIAIRGRAFQNTPSVTILIVVAL